MIDLGNFASLPMAFTYQRKIHFPDTDAAGVVFFANYLSICHEAYEEALASAGINIAKFFSDTGLVIPVSKSNADYLRPLTCGEVVEVKVVPSLITADTFAVDYEMRKGSPMAKLAGVVRTSHVCIRSDTRERAPLPEDLLQWIRRG